MTPDFAALRAIGWPHEDAAVAAAWTSAMAEHPDSRPARVIEQHRSGYRVAQGSDSGFTVESLPQWQLPRFPPEQRPAVGDWVLITGEAEHNAAVVALLPRRTAIKRSAAGKHYGQQVIAANIDTVFIVCSLDADFNPRRIERYLLLVRGGARPVVVLTKTDLDSAVDEAALGVDATLASLHDQGVEVCRVNAKERESVSSLRRWLGPGMTAVVVGSSGAGKSTLTNTLLGRTRMKTGAVRANDARGRHTTTHRALIPLPSGACLIDTPGMRELKLTGEESLDQFADIEALAQHCRFSDCAHQREPGCAVRAAIEQGELEPRRLDNYRKLAEERRQQQALGRHSGRDRRSAGGRRLPPAPGDAE